MVRLDTMRPIHMLQALHRLRRWNGGLSGSRLIQLRLEAFLLKTTLKLLSSALLLVNFMPKEQSPEARLNAILQEQQKLVHELKDATPARKLQIQAEIVALSEEQAQLLQEAGAVNCFIYASSSTRGTGWIEEERNYDGSVRQYRYGYYRNGRSNRRYVPKHAVQDVIRMIASKASPNAILEFLDRTRTRIPASAFRRAGYSNHQDSGN